MGASFYPKALAYQVPWPSWFVGLGTIVPCSADAGTHAASTAKRHRRRSLESGSLPCIVTTWSPRAAMPLPGKPARHRIPDGERP